MDELYVVARRVLLDALDVLRLLRGTTTGELAGRLRLLLVNDIARPVTTEALDLLRSQFADRTGEGIKMAVRAVGVLGDPAETEASCEVLASDLLREVGR